MNDAYLCAKCNYVSTIPLDKVGQEYLCASCSKESKEKEALPEVRLQQASPTPFTESVILRPAPKDSPFEEVVPAMCCRVMERERNFYKQELEQTQKLARELVAKIETEYMFPHTFIK